MWGFVTAAPGNLHPQTYLLKSRRLGRKAQRPEGSACCHVARGTGLGEAWASGLILERVHSHTHIHPLSPHFQLLRIACCNKGLQLRLGTGQLPGEVSSWFGLGCLSPLAPQAAAGTRLHTPWREIAADDRRLMGLAAQGAQHGR